MTRAALSASNAASRTGMAAPGCRQLHRLPVQGRRVIDGCEHFHDLYSWDEFWTEPRAGRQVKDEGEQRPAARYSACHRWALDRFLLKLAPANPALGRAQRRVSPGRGRRQTCPQATAFGHECRPAAHPISYPSDFAWAESADKHGRFALMLVLENRCGGSSIEGLYPPPPLHCCSMPTWRRVVGRAEVMW